MKKSLILFISALVFSSCEKKEIIVLKEVEKEFSWKNKSGFEYEYATQLNSFATDNHLFTLGINTFTAMLPDSVTDSNGTNYVHHYLFYQLPTTYKFPISADYFIGYSEKEPTKLKFSSTKNPSTSTPSRSTSLTIPFSALDSTFFGFSFLGFSDGESFAINNKGQALVPYHSSQKNTPVSLKATLLDIKTYTLEGTTIVDTLKTKQISFNSQYNGFSVFLQAVNDNFYISPNYNETYRVSSNGEVIKVFNERLYDIFKDKQNLYAIGISGNGYISTDDGQT